MCVDHNSEREGLKSLEREVKVLRRTDDILETDSALFAQSWCRISLWRRTLRKQFVEHRAFEKIGAVRAKMHTA